LAKVLDLLLCLASWGGRKAKASVGYRRNSERGFRKFWMSSCHAYRGCKQEGKQIHAKQESKEVVYVQVYIYMYIYASKQAKHSRQANIVRACVCVCKYIRMRHTQMQYNIILLSSLVAPRASRLYLRISNRACPPSFGVLGIVKWSQAFDHACAKVAPKAAC